MPYVYDVKTGTYTGKCKIFTTINKENIIKHEKSLIKQKNVEREKRLRVIINKSYDGYIMRKLLVVVSVSKGSFCK